MVNKDRLFTPHADACLHGITRGLVIELAENENIPCLEKNISLTELYNADMVFCTGTMGELTPITQIDGREINQDRKVFDQLLVAFEAIKEKYCIPIA